MKYFTKQNSSLCCLHCKIGIQIINTVYTSKERQKKKPPPQNIVLNLIFIIWNFLRIFSIKNSPIGIVKLNLPEEMKYDADFVQKWAQKGMLERP